MITDFIYSNFEKVSLQCLQFSVFLLSSFIEDFVFVSFQQKNEIKNWNTLVQLKYLLFQWRIDLFDVKDFQNNFGVEFPNNSGWRAHDELQHENGLNDQL